MSNWDGVANRDLIEALNERDQAMAEMTEINASISSERDQVKRELAWYKKYCLELIGYKCKVELLEGTK
ncbi:hypothetical protein B2I21_07385 [Chryseobacterium mucoviscidosis]|nr:hypothetical protein B2I21_07385 [Chryseobacterium mucoviscidosis]